MVLSLSLASIAAGQTPEERAGARAAADQGYEAFTQGRWEQSLDLFRRAESVVHSPMHLLYIARSNAKLGKLIEAKEEYLKVLREQVPPDAPQAIRQAPGQAQAELEVLEERIPYVSIVVQGDAPPPDVQVFMNDRRVPTGLVGVPHPVNPGSYTWHAVYHSLQSSKQALTLEEGAQETVVLSLRMPKRSSAGAAPAQPVAAPAQAADAAEPAPESRRNLRPWAYVSFGVGAVGIGLGTIFALKKRDLEAEVDATCVDGLCPGTEENLQKLDDADANATRATVSYIVGGVGVAVGVTLLVLSLGDDDAPEQAGLTPWVSWNSAGVQGRF